MAHTYKKYRHKPTIIDAFQTDKALTLKTLEGAMKCGKGSWVVKGIKGESYCIRQDIFEESYEPVK